MGLLRSTPCLELHSEGNLDPILALADVTPEFSVRLNHGSRSPRPNGLEALTGENNRDPLNESHSSVEYVDHFYHAIPCMI